MSVFNFFKKKNKIDNLTSENGIIGPKYLDGLTDIIKNPNKIQIHEWKRVLKTKAGNTKFKIKYYGKLHTKFTNLIVGEDFSQSKVYAVDISNNDEILIFDGCSHGYNPLMCDIYSTDQINNREISKVYSDKNGNENFEIIISAYYGIDYEEDFREYVDKDGLIELINGNKIEFEELKRIGFDRLQVWVKNEAGKLIEIISEELS